MGRMPMPQKFRMMCHELKLKQSHFTRCLLQLPPPTFLGSHNVFKEES